MFQTPFLVLGDRWSYGLMISLSHGRMPPQLLANLHARIVAARCVTVVCCIGRIGRAVSCRVVSHSHRVVSVVPCRVVWLAGWLVGCLDGWRRLASIGDGWLLGGVASWLAGRLDGWIGFDWCWMACWLIGWLLGWLLGWLAPIGFDWCWLAGWVGGWLLAWFS